MAADADLGRASPDQLGGLRRIVAGGARAALPYCIPGRFGGFAAAVISRLKSLISLVPVEGLEPPTDGLQNRVRMS